MNRQGTVPRPPEGDFLAVAEAKKPSAKLEIGNERLIWIQR
jgi:hypothetical protein